MVLPENNNIANTLKRKDLNNSKIIPKYITLAQQHQSDYWLYQDKFSGNGCVTVTNWKLVLDYLWMGTLTTKMGSVIFMLVTL